jgi:hypothetical protein
MTVQEDFVLDRSAGRWLESSRMERREAQTEWMGIWFERACTHGWRPARAVHAWRCLFLPSASAIRGQHAQDQEDCAVASA